jgi:hypothetical protein
MMVIDKIVAIWSEYDVLLYVGDIRIMTYTPQEVLHGAGQVSERNGDIYYVWVSINAKYALGGGITLPTCTHYILV